MGTEGRMKSHSVCRVCSYHHVISNWHFIPGGFCLTTSADSDQFSELRTLSCRKMCLTMMWQFFKYFRVNTIGEIISSSLCSCSNRVKRNKSMFLTGVHTRHRGGRGVTPLLQVQGEPLGFCSDLHTAQP